MRDVCVRACVCACVRACVRVKTGMGCAQTEKKMSLTECSHTGMVRYEEVRTSTSHDGFARSVCRNTTVDDAGYFRESAFF